MRPQLEQGTLIPLPKTNSTIPFPHPLLLVYTPILSKMIPDPQSRREAAFQVRVEAAKIAHDRDHADHKPNGDENRYHDNNGNRSYIGSFTKGLPHNPKTGLIDNPNDYAKFVKAINTGKDSDIKDVPLGQPNGWNNYKSAMAKNASVRAWESMAAGLAYDLEGPDAQSVTMPPAPALQSMELAFEMSEVYWMALLRDVRFTDFENAALVADALRSLNNQPWATDRQRYGEISSWEATRHRSAFSAKTIFRGDLPGDHTGPYISQFLLVGTPGLGEINDISDGFIQYGGLRIDQRVRVAEPGKDYMTTYQSWLDVQDGASLAGRESYVRGSNAFRFITTPRDLATYVHYDALYEAYLNACLIMLDIGVPYDKGLPFRNRDDSIDKQSGFATFGPAHILSLVTEVATRALKAVRFQKFNVHRRLRPEALAQLIDGLRRDPTTNIYDEVRPLHNWMDHDMLNRVREHNRDLNRNVMDNGLNRRDDYDPITGDSSTGCFLLPMAFAEGSPMHPAYGAGHAAVAGACVTILKAFFDTEYELPFCYVPNNDGSGLNNYYTSKRLTIEGELNKVCSNVSIGRDWAGVHYYSDYRESINMGEKIALGVLEEQKITHGEKFTMKVPLFNGSTRTI